MQVFTRHRRPPLRTALLMVSLLAAGCSGGGGSTGTDAGGQRPADAAADGAAHDGGADATVRDAGPDATADASLDGAPADGSAEAAVPDAALDAAPMDAAPMDATMDAGPTYPTAPLPDGGLVVAETVSHPSATPIAPASECTVTEEDVFVSSAMHVPYCTPVAYDTSPPAGGPHYPSPAFFRTYDAPVPWGFLVHSMEHGAIVVSYDCPSGCPSLVASLQAVLDAEPDDRLCAGTPFLHRLILVPEPDLPTPIAASAWGHIYTATCLDTASLSAFIEAYYAMSPENTCFPGVDLSASGWCSDGGVADGGARLDAGAIDAGP